MAPKILYINKYFKSNPLLKSIESKGYKVLKASNGLKLISHLEVENPDLIMMDTKSAWPNSFNLCKALRKGKYKSIPIFFLSDQYSKDESFKSYNCGCTQYFTLPKQTNTLFSKIKEFAGTP